MCSINLKQEYGLNLKIWYYKATRFSNYIKSPILMPKEKKFYTFLCNTKLKYQSILFILHIY